MTDGDVSLLLSRLNRYAEALERHNVAVTRAYGNTLEPLSHLRKVWGGAAAEDFMAHWDRTTAALEHYVEGSRQISELLEARIAALREADRPARDALGKRYHPTQSAGKRPLRTRRVTWG